MERVVVTGATGFVGLRLVEFLIANNVHVTAIVRDLEAISHLACSKLEAIVCDMQNYSKLNELIADSGFDVFYHLGWAGSSGIRRRSYALQMENIKFTCDAVQAAIKLDCKKIVITGTVTENIVEHIFDRVQVSGNEMYAIAKCATRAAVDVMCKNNSIPYVWAQLSNVYGQSNTTQNILAYTMQELKFGRRPEFTIADQPYDFIHIDDTIKALYLLGVSNASRSKYFIGSGEPKILGDYLKIIAKRFGPKLSLGFGLKKDDGIEYKWSWFDTRDLVGDTGFAVSDSFDGHIQKIINADY